MWKYFIISGIGAGFFLSLGLLIKPFAWLQDTPEFIAVSYGDLENWSLDNQSQAFEAYKKSCQILLAQPAAKIIAPETLGGTAADWQDSCKEAQDKNTVTDGEARQFFEQNFTAFSYSENTEGLFTGYYAPVYKGSDQPTEKYHYPLYGVPESLKKIDLGQFNAELKGQFIIGEVKEGDFIPYKDRKTIDQGALDHQDLELVWLKSPVDAFFMHIQGSGVIRYENGTQKTFGYAGKNGQAYQAIGKFLIKNGQIPKKDMSMQKIRRWISDHPMKAKSLMWKNPSYIFFRPLAGAAPIGAMGVELTAGRSLAVDRTYVPYGMPIWLDLAPSDRESDPIQRLVIAQDTGGAIKGRVRADVYWGVGQAAGWRAGPMKDQGRYYFLLPNILAQRLRSEEGL